MIPRVLSALIVVFWLVMTSLLVRLEIDPDKSSVLAVPPTHVFNLMFTHEQTSELSIADSNGTTIGNLMLRPKTDPNLNERTLDFSGGFLVSTQTVRRQRVNWRGSLSLDHAYGMLHWEFDFDLREPATHVHINLNPQDHQIHYAIHQGGQLIEQSSLSPNEAGLNSLLRDKLFLDPAVIENFRGNFRPPTLSAKQTELSYRKEKIVAYLLTVKQGETELAEIHVSQLGQILLAKTIFGYTFSADDVMP